MEIKESYVYLVWSKGSKTISDNGNTSADYLSKSNKSVKLKNELKVWAKSDSSFWFSESEIKGLKDSKFFKIKKTKVHGG